MSRADDYEVVPCGPGACQAACRTDTGHRRATSATLDSMLAPNGKTILFIECLLQVGHASAWPAPLPIAWQSQSPIRHNRA